MAVRRFATALAMLLTLQLPLAARGQDDTARWQEMLNRFTALFNEERYEEATDLAKQIHEFARQTFGETHDNTLTSLNNLAIVYQGQGRYGEAEPILEKVLRLRQRRHGEEHRHSLTSLRNLATLYENQGRFDEAEALYLRTLKLSRKALGPAHSFTLRSLNSVGNLYTKLGRFGEAEPLRREALRLSVEALGEDHPNTLTRRNNLAVLYFHQGRYGAAESLFQEVLEHRRAQLGEAHPQTLTSLNNLAHAVELQGRDTEAEALYEQTLERRRSVLGTGHPHTINTLNSLGVFYARLGLPFLAEPMLLDAFQHRLRLLGTTHPDTLATMSGLALLYAKQARYHQAVPMHEKVLELRRQVLGERHPDSLASLQNLAQAYTGQGRFAEADGLYVQALQLHRAVLGRSHPQTLSTQLNSTAALINLGKMAEALRRLRDLEAQLLTWLGTELHSTRSVSLQRRLASSQRGFQDTVLNLALQAPGNAEATRLAASVVLRFKGLQAEEEAYLARVLRRTGDAEARALASEIAELRAELARTFHKAGESDPAAQLRELERKEMALGRMSRDYATHLQVRRAELAELQRALGPRDALIEIRRYRQLDIKTFGAGDLRYAGILIRRDGIEVRDLGDLETIAPPARGRPHSLVTEILGPFAAALARVETIYLAPDGRLHQLPFAALRLADGRFLVEALDLRLVQSGRDLLRPAAERPASGLLALGGIDFDTPAATSEASQALQAPDGQGAAPPLLNAELHDQTEASFGDGFSALPASKEEVEEIARLYRSHRNGEPVEVWQGAAARESRLKALDRPPRVLHLSTHGFYRSRATPLERPLLLSGVTFAGANLALEGRGEDGILYAIEAQSLRLEGTELVVLSACQTAQGQTTYAEGVYSLVRAFRTAGAAKVLVTLWPVGDQHARDFMQTFYRYHLDARLDPAVALRATQQEFIRKDDPILSHPLVWAPYVLIGR